MPDVAATLPDPSAGLAAAFRAAAVRMRGLAFVNPALDVEAVGFAPWEGHWLGVMVTPWFINLTLTPREPAAWPSLAPGAKRRYRFPAGDYEFIGARDEAFGEYQVCSLFSPVLEFDDAAAARLVAVLAREALFDPANADVAEVPVANLGCASAAAGAPGAHARLAGALATPLSKRDFLHARFLGDERDDRRG
jgi:[NiFe] hydrogenase assembly HybE family chaperone